MGQTAEDIRDNIVKIADEDVRRMSRAMQDSGLINEV
jgi:hypothetical protein